MNYNLIVIILIILIILIAIIFLFLNKNILLFTPNDTIKTINVVDNNVESKEIPLNIFMTWETKELPLYMKQSVELVKSRNPEFNLYIYDDNDCRTFLEKYFISDIVNAFDNLIPGAYKADLWRYCVLYYYGGIYQDIKFQPIGEFKYEDLLDKEYFVKDRDTGGGGIYNAFIVCKPRNKILYKCIKQIIKNVETKFYGSSSLEPTGPLLMKKFILPDRLNELLIFQKINNIDYIFKNNKEILKSYDNYRSEQKKSSKPHYHDLYYKIKKIYI